MLVFPYLLLVLHTDNYRSTSSMTTASQRRRHLLKNKRTLRRKKRERKQLPRLRRQKPRSKRRSKRCSVKLQPQSHSCQCLMATAHSTSWSTQMPTVTFLWSGVTAMRKRSRTPRRSSSGASRQTVTALTRWFHTGTLAPIAILCGSPNTNEYSYSQTWRIVYSLVTFRTSGQWGWEFGVQGSILCTCT